ncbi:MAG: hypothetical protein ACFFG0_42600 [Candidatus Thorarchaeota archaeon]
MKKLNFENSTQYSQNNFQNLNNNLISNLVSELFNHINSKENFDYISNLLISSLNRYKKKFSNESYTKINEPNVNIIDNSGNRNAQYDKEDPKNEYLAISNDIHAILSNCADLSNSQKLDFCTNQRYFMKLFLKDLVIKLNIHGKSSLDQ